jgi:hypothetical protein
LPVHRCAGVDQGLGDGAGARQLARQAQPLVVEAHHRDIANRVGAVLVVGPAQQLGAGQLGVLGQQPGQAGQVAAVEDRAAAHFQGEPGPAGEPVLTGERELGRGENEPVGHGVDACDRVGVAMFGGAQQVLGPVPQLGEVRPGGKVGHGVSFGAPRSASGSKEIVTEATFCSMVEVDSVLPADPGAPSSACRTSYRWPGCLG